MDQRNILESDISNNNLNMHEMLQHNKTMKKTWTMSPLTKSSTPTIYFFLVLNSSYWFFSNDCAVFSQNQKSFVFFKTYFMPGGIS